MKLIMQAKYYVVALIFSYTLIVSTDCLAMNFSQPIEIGCVAISQTRGGMRIENAIHNTGDYYTLNDRKNKSSFGRGIAEFGNKDDKLYIHYDAYQEDSTVVYVGSKDTSNTLKIHVFNDFIYQINTDSSVILYPIKFFYGPEVKWQIIGKDKNGKFVKFADIVELLERYYGEIDGLIECGNLQCYGDTIIISYNIRSGLGSTGKHQGELRLKWDENAQWFSVEQITY